MTDETNLVLGGIVIPAGAGRGISQTLEPINNGNLRRTVNGELIDLTRGQNRKFQSEISATDMSGPTLAGIWKGSVIEVQCIKPLRQHLEVPAAAITLIRDPVVNSIVGRDENGAKVAVDTVNGRDITFLGNIKYVEFNPILTMMVVSLPSARDEYAAEENWSLSLEEV